jgi:probable HAF family extracellular repeat protein
VGYSDTAGGAPHAFLYTGVPGNGGAMADLGTLPGRAESFAHAINDSGQIAGSSDNNINSQTPTDHAFLYTGTPGSGGSMADLGTLGGSASVGEAINRRGQVAGYSYIAGNADTHAFIYIGKPGCGKMIDLDSWLNSNNPTEGAKWTLREASGLTDTGLITGTGIYDDGSSGGYRAFLLDASALVPEPGGLSLLAIAGLALLRRGNPTERRTR